MAEDKKEEPTQANSNEEGDEGQTKAGAAKKKKMMLGGVGILVVIVGVGLYFGGFIGAKAPDEHAENSHTEGVSHDDHQDASAEGGHGTEEIETATTTTSDGDTLYFYNMDDLLVNLTTDKSNKNSFLKMKLVLQLSKNKSVNSIESKMPLIKNSFQMFLRELTIDDLKGSVGIHRLRDELLLRINKIVAPEKVDDILFEEILVQ